MEGLVAATLLIGGGLIALGSASVITGLPFAMILIIMIYSLYQGLKQEHEVEQVVRNEVSNVRENHIINEAINEAVHDHALVDEESS